MDKKVDCQHLDLRGTPCPLNFVRCSLAIEDLSYNQSLEIYLDKGEPEDLVIPGLKEAGHVVEIIQKHSDWVKLMVFSGER